MISPTNGNLTLQETAVKILDYLKRNSGDDYVNHLIIGTDSQNFTKTKVVIAIAVYTEGRGGIYFYDITYIPVIRDVATKLRYETQLSLETVEKLIKYFDDEFDKSGFNYLDHCSVGIHVDAGKNGKSGVVIPEIVGWINSVGYEAVVKPDSFVASTIADRISK